MTESSEIRTMVKITAGRVPLSFLGIAIRLAIGLMAYVAFFTLWNLCFVSKDGYSAQKTHSSSSYLLGSRSMLNQGLRVAAKEGRQRDVEELITSGADVNGESAYGDTPLMAAAMSGYARIVNILLKHGATVNAMNSSDRTALALAAKECHPKVLEELVTRTDLDPFIVDRSGKSALIYAVEGGCPLSVHLLIGISRHNLDIRDFQGKSAMDYAIVGATTEVGGPFSYIYTILRKKGAKSFFFENILPADLENPVLKQVLH